MDIQTAIQHAYATNIFAKLANNVSCKVTATSTTWTESKLRSSLKSEKYSSHHLCTAAHSRSTATFLNLATGGRRLQYHLDAAVLLFIKHFVRLGTFLERQSVCDDEGGINFTALD